MASKAKNSAQAKTGLIQKQASKSSTGKPKHPFYDSKPFFIFIPFYFNLIII